LGGEFRVTARTPGLQKLLGGGGSRLRTSLQTRFPCSEGNLQGKLTPHVKIREVFAK
jgi:hypothetical protein